MSLTDRPGTSKLPVRFSFDVFDTLLTRAVGSPQSVFLLLGFRLARKGTLSVTPEQFAAVRTAAEGIAAVRARGGQPTISEIYMAVAWLLGLSVAEQHEFANEEMALEAELLRPVPAIAERFRRLAPQRTPVCVSDMYLPSKFIADQVSEKLGLDSPPDVYVSGEAGEAKTSGRLFLKVCQEKGIAPKHLLHIGNDPVADVAAARHVGVRTELYAETALNRYEAILERYAELTAGASSLLAGASRLARLRVPAEDARTATIREVVAGVAAPLLTAYVWWVLQRAHELGLRRLYFVSRDGEILLIIARHLTARLRLDIDLRYLYGSRQAWHGPALLCGPDVQTGWLFESARRLSVADVLERMHLRLCDAEDILTAAGFKIRDCKRQLTRAERTRLHDVITGPILQSRARERLVDQRRLILAYFRQEGLCDPLNFGVVDVGWTGRMFDSMWNVLSAQRRDPPIAFFLATRESSVSRTGLPREAYLFDGVSGIGYPSPFRSGASGLVETFCLGTHGMLSRYEVDGRGTIVPCLRETRNDAAFAWGLPIVRETIDSFLCSLVIFEDTPITVLRPAVEAVLSELVHRPTWNEARVWGEYPHSDAQTESYALPISRPLSIADVAVSLTRGYLQTGDRLWAAGSVRLSSPALRYLIAGARVIRNHARRFRRLKYAARRFADPHQTRKDDNRVDPACASEESA